jgi:exoribonuclease R
MPQHPKSYVSPQLREHFQSIRALNKIPEADELGRQFNAIAAQLSIDLNVKRRDATNLAMVTLDPASSTDLDQAFYVASEGSGTDRTIVLYYAIADIGAFVSRGSAIETQAWKQGTTVYCPDGSVPLYPRILSSQRASLLPDGPRPAILLTVAVDVHGICKLRFVERAMVLSRAKLAYETIEIQQLSPDVLELARRISLAEVARGAARVDRPEQEIHQDGSAPDGLTLKFAPHLPSENYNAALSLATNLAVGRYLLDSNCGLFRVMDDPNEHEIKSLRVQAKVLGIQWQQTEKLQAVVSRLTTTAQNDLAFSMAIRKAGGGARYMIWPFTTQTDEQKIRNAQQQKQPWHAAIAATYAHATAPMRRLADRYVLDLLVAHFAGEQSTVAELQKTLALLPSVMETAERIAAKIDRESLEAIESSLLKPLIGQLISATVIDVSHDGLQIQIDEPAVIWRIPIKKELGKAPRFDFGDTLTVRVIDPARTNPGTSEPENLTNTRRMARLRTVDLVIENQGTSELRA